MIGHVGKKLKLIVETRLLNNLTTLLFKKLYILEVSYCTLLLIFFTWN